MHDYKPIGWRWYCLYTVCGYIQCGTGASVGSPCTIHPPRDSIISAAVVERRFLLLRSLMTRVLRGLIRQAVILDLLQEVDVALLPPLG